MGSCRLGSSDMSSFYLIGEHLSHSFSPQIHIMLGNPDYTLKELAPDEVGEFVKHGDYVGMNVTIPYKHSGRLPHSKINNRIYYRPEDVERLIEDCNDV